MHSELHSLRYKKLAAAIALTWAGIVVEPAGAQQELEEVIVTGSFLERPADRPQPVSVLDASDLKFQQRGTVAEVFKDMPQVTGSVSTINTGEGGNSPTSTINLRGLGPRATLVLLNGQRQTTDGGIGAVDINNLTPSLMIERIEVLTDGASALYGSDAVAGVVNFVTRTGFEGAEAKVEMQSIQDTPSSTPDMNVGLIAGAQGERTGIVGGFEYSTTETMQVEDRYDDPRLLKALTSGFANPGSFSVLDNVPGPDLRVPDPLCGSDQIGSGGLTSGFLNPLGNQCLQVNSLGRALQPESKRLVGLATLTHDFGNDMTGQIEMGFARTRYHIDFGYVTPLLTPLPYVPRNNPGVIAALAADPTFPDSPLGYGFWGRPLSPAGGEREQNVHHTEQNTFRVVAKLDGVFGDTGWDWRAAVSDSWNDLSFTSVDTFSSRYTDAVQGYGGPDCNASPASDPTGALAGQGDCHWWNPFANHLLAQPGDAHYNDMEIADWFLGGRINKDSGELKTIELITTGELFDLPGGTSGLALGIQHREQSFSQDWDDVTEDGGWRFNRDPYQDFSGSRSTKAFFGELVMYPSETVEIQLAARYEDYEQVDSVDPKIGVLWTPVDGLFVRASAGTSFRQPGELQAFGMGPGGASIREIGGDTIQARGSVTGNPNLDPETSENWTVGVTWDVTDRLTMDLNYWNIQFQDLIVTEDADVLLSLDMADGFVTDPRIVLHDGAFNEVCEVTGRWSGNAADPVPAGCMSGFDIRVFELSYINQDFQETAGLDFVLDYDFDALGGQWGTTLTGTWTHKYDLTSEGVLFDGVGSYNSNNFGSPNAEWRGNLAFDYSRGNHYARATLRYISALEEDDPDREQTAEESFTTLDLVYNYALPWGNSDLTVALVNATDEEDPVRENELQTTTSSIYDVRGRVFRVGLNWGF